MSVESALLATQDVLHAQLLLVAPFAALGLLMMATAVVPTHPITLSTVLRATTSTLLETAHNATQPAKPVQAQQFQTA